MHFIAIIVSALVLKFCVVLADVPCTLEYGAVDLSDVQVSKNGDFSKNGFDFSIGNHVLQDNKRLGCVCNFNKCLRKCCPDGEFLLNGTFCKSTLKPLVIPESSLRPETPSIGTFYIIHGNKCPPETERSVIEAEEFVVQPDGRLFVTLNNMYYEQTEYCLDYIVSDEDEARALICARPQASTIINVIGMIISMPFLLATFIVYAALPDRNMHAKSLMCYVITLFMAYMLLVNIQFRSGNLDDNDGTCKAIGILCLFFFMVSFFWINVMSIDIWWTFRGLRGLVGSRKAKERKRFILYNIYAWGVPIIFVIIVACLTASKNIDGRSWYNPGIGDGQCWITEGMPTLLYFYGPIALLITCNIVLFGTTACKIWQVQQDTAILRKEDSKKHNYENDKQRFYMYLKLMLAMGTNWSMEIISWAVELQIGPTPTVWYLTDFCNACYGVFIFFMFVFKKPIWMMLKRRYYTLMGKPHLGRSIATQETNSPRTTNTSLQTQTVQYSTNNSNVVID